MRELLGRVVFSVGGAEYTWEDVVLAAESWGDWARLRERAREGVACLRRMDEEEEESLTAEEVESAANEFRYARDLVSADEMERWLDRWGLTVESWMDSIRSSLLRQKWSGELADVVSRYLPSDEEVERLMQTEAVCSGELMRLARELAGRAAAFEKEKGQAEPGGTGRGKGEKPSLQAGVPETTARRERLTRLDASFRRFRDRVVTPEAIRARIRSSQTDWTCLDLQCVSFPDEEAAREAAFCVREDAEGLEQVAGDANLQARRERVFIEDTDPEMRIHLVGAGKGELLGPIRSGDEFVLCLILDKVLPSSEDSEVAARAERAILKTLLEGEINDRVRWRWQA